MSRGIIGAVAGGVCVLVAIVWKLGAARWLARRSAAQEAAQRAAQRAAQEMAQETQTEDDGRFDDTTPRA